ncbi:class I SAM-dependent methyltransferase, partial [Escherichia coli]
GVDIAANLVEAGSARARSLGITNCRFQEGDATDLHDLEDDSFDLVISIPIQRTQRQRRRCPDVDSGDLPTRHRFP